MRTSSLIHWAAFSAPLLMILAVIWFSFANEFDTALYFKAHRAAHPNIAAVLKFLTDWSNPLFYGFFALMLFKAYKANNRENLRFVLILLAVQVVISVLTVHFIKSTIGRPRPGQGAWFEPLTSRGPNIPCRPATPRKSWAGLCRSRCAAEFRG